MESVTKEIRLLALTVDRENIFGPILFEMRGRCSAVGDEDQGGDSINYGTALDPPGLPTLQYYQK